jgi:hypothetical protein
MFLRNVGMSPQGVTTQNNINIFTVMRTSNLTLFNFNPDMTRFILHCIKIYEEAHRQRVFLLWWTAGSYMSNNCYWLITFHISKFVTRIKDTKMWSHMFSKTNLCHFARLNSHLVLT